MTPAAYRAWRTDGWFYVAYCLTLAAASAGGAVLAPVKPLRILGAVCAIFFGVACGFVCGVLAEARDGRQ